jgi:type I restriction enzyme, S subunit
MQKQNNIPTLRFPEFTGEWEKKKLGEVTQWASGGTPSKENPLFWNGSIPWISASSMRGNIYSDSELKITSDGLKKGSKLAKKGTLLILVRGSMLFNKIPIGIVSKDVAFNQDVKSIEVNSETTSEFILNWFTAFEPTILNMVSGTGIGAGKIDLADLKSIEISFPTLPEQTRIANFFTAIDAKISQLKTKKEKLQQYKKGVMQQLFSAAETHGRASVRFKDENGNDFPDWERKKLGEVLEIQGGYAFKSNSFNHGKTKVIRIGDIDPIIKMNEFSGAISEEIPDKKYQVKKNDFLMALSGATFGKVGKIVDEGIGYINQRVALFRTKQCLEYFYQLVQNDDFKNYINSIPTASAQPNISNSDILNYETAIPSLAEQTKIANFLSSIDEKINHTDSQIQQTQTWKKGLLQQMFV